MPYLKLENFSGISPRTGPMLLAPNQAQTAKNVKLQSGELRPWRQPLFTYQPGLPDVRSIYKLENTTNGGSAWLEFAIDTDVVPGPAADTTDFRVYYTDGVAPRKTNWALATTNETGVRPFPNASYKMGVPAPTVAPSLAVSQALTDVVVTSGGAGYTSAPSVSFSSGTATATAAFSAVVTGVTVTANTGYTSEPTVTFSGGGGSGAAAVAVVTSGVVTAVVILNPGSGYTSPPTVTFTGGGASIPATGTATIAGEVTSVTLTSYGTYTDVAPTVIFTGGSPTTVAVAEAVFTPVDTRVYAYTYVSTFGSVLEESAPSPTTTVTCRSEGATVTLSGFGTAPTAAAGYNITALRIYRSVTSGASATYLYVGQVSINPTTGVASGSFVDNISAANLGAALASSYFTPPPDSLQGLIAMPNGILAGFTGNQVWFSEPYLPHAWPAAYMMTVGAPIVGLGVFGQTLVVCTTRNPYLITGSQPGAMSQEKVSLPEPCISKKSIASDQTGVLYASPNGVVSIAPGVQDVVTRALFTRDEWQVYNPISMVGVIYQNMYIAFYQATQKQALIIMRGDNPPLVTLDVDSQAVFVSRTTSQVFFVSPLDNAIYQLDAHPVNNTYYEWTSKKFVLPEPTNFGASKVQADWSYISDTAAYNALVAAIIASNQALFLSGAPLKSTVNSVQVNGMQLNGSILQNIPPIAETRAVQATVYANSQLVAQNTYSTQEPYRLPAGSREYIYEVKLTGNAPLRSFAMATTIGELRTV